MNGTANEYILLRTSGGKSVKRKDFREAVPRSSSFRGAFRGGKVIAVCTSCVKRGRAGEVLNNSGRQTRVLGEEQAGSMNDV